jgi:hypothetical protein
MKNAIKVMAVLKQAFPGHSVESIYKDEKNMDDLYIDGHYAGAFDHDFFMADLDNPEIEIKVKAPIKSIENYVDHSCGIICMAIERGLAEWREESQQNLNHNI